MTYRQLLKHIQGLDNDQLDKEVVIQDYGTNDMFEVHRLVELTKDRHWDGLSSGDHYLECFSRD